MARKKSNSSPLVTLFIFIIIAVIAFVVLTPIVLIAGFLKNQYQAVRLRSAIVSRKGKVWLDKYERQEFIEKVRTLQATEQKIGEAESRGEQGAVSRNRDGSFSARSKLGKELREIMDQSLPLQQCLLEELQLLQELPASRWRKLNRYVAKSHAFALALIAWSGTLSYYFFEQGRQFGSDFLQVYWAFATNLIRADQSKLPLSGADVEMLFVSTAVGVGSYWLGRLVFFRAGKRYAPEPDLVTMQNINSY